MRGLEYVTWAADIVCFGWLVVAETVTFSLLVWRAMKD